MMMMRTAMILTMTIILVMIDDTCNQAIIPTHLKNQVPASAPITLNWKNSRELTQQIMNKTIEKKGGIGVGSLENASNMKMPYTLSKVKLQANYCCPSDRQKPWSHAQHSKTQRKCGNATGLLADHTEHSQMPCTENTSSGSLTELNCPLNYGLHQHASSNWSLIRCSQEPPHLTVLL